MSWIWLCYLFDDGRSTTSHERNKGIRWAEDHTLCVQEKNAREKEIGYVYMQDLFNVVCPLQLTMVFLFLHKAVAEERKNNEHASKGIRKNVLKARLIIRNLSFQVDWATWESKTEGGEDRLMTLTLLLNSAQRMI